ncbi:MAG TPA: hypothetical protein DCQ06_09090 [Myxococcales bacterium]|nr:hypothetical protein [Myxococcales bacterium]HAN31736.1 hypothetical protein [Myxococcales bacterium]
MSEVTSGIADLIAKIKTDGVDAGQQAKLRIVDDAKTEAAKILADAHAEAETIKKQAEREALTINKRLQSELKMAARDFVFRFQERLSTQAIMPATSEAASKALQDSALIGRVLDGVLQHLEDESGGFIATINPVLRAEVEAAISAHIQASKVELVDELGLNGFKLQKKGEHFVWDFSADAVARELARLVEPGLRSALSFSESKSAN